MKTFTDFIKDKETNKYYAIFDRDDIMYNFYYTKEEAQEELNILMKDTPSMKYRIEPFNRNEIES